MSAMSEKTHGRPTIAILQRGGNRAAFSRAPGRAETKRRPPSRRSTWRTAAAPPMAPTTAQSAHVAVYTTSLAITSPPGTCAPASTYVRITPKEKQRIAPDAAPAHGGPQHARHGRRRRFADGGSSVGVSP